MPAKPPKPPDERSVDLKGKQPPPKALPHESDQSPSSQEPAAHQDQQESAVKGYADAARGRPDTSAAPQLQQPSPKDRQAP